MEAIAFCAFVLIVTLLPVWIVTRITDDDR